MFSHLTVEDLCCVALLLDEEAEKKVRRRRFSVHKMLKRRKIDGEYWTLYKHLMDDEEKFFQYFRMSIHNFDVLLGKIKNCITKRDTVFKEAICPREKLAVCLRFLATGDSYRTIAFNYRLGHATVSRIVIEVCDAIINNLMSEYMSVPTREKWLEIAHEFWSAWNFPNCIGALDGKHVQIFAPPNSGTLYYNYKKTFSIVLLALVDANYKFIAVDIGSYGKNSDGGIFSNSKLGKCLALNKLNIPEDTNLPNTNTVMPHVIVGDEAFPLKQYLLRPYPKSQIDDPAKQYYNHRHSRARRVSENAFGILTQKFRIYLRRMQLHPQNVDKIILTTCILHNFILSSHNVRPADIGMEPRETTMRNLPLQGGSNTSIAFHVREAFKDFFNSTRN